MRFPSITDIDKDMQDTLFAHFQFHVYDFEAKLVWTNTYYSEKQLYSQTYWETAYLYINNLKKHQSVYDNFECNYVTNHTELEEQKNYN